QRLPDALGGSDAQGSHSARRRRARSRAVREAARLHDPRGRHRDLQDVREEVRHPVAALDGVHRARRERVRRRRVPPARRGLPLQPMIALSRADFEKARAILAPNIYKTPLLTSRILSERTGFDVRLKAEMFQKTGSYKIRGPLNKFTYLTGEQKQRGVICSSAGNHAQGVALA